MQQSNYSTVIETGKTSNEAYTAINNVQLWWTENFEGNSKKINDEFKVTFGETFIKLGSAIPANFTHVILWCGTASIPFGNARLN